MPNSVTEGRAERAPVRRGSPPGPSVSLPFLILIALAVPAAGADLMLDPTFATGGITRTSFVQSDTPHDLLIQPDGRILTVGHSTGPNGTNFIAMSRHTAAGVPDSAGFGVNGKVSASFDYRDVAYGAVLQPDGRIVAAGLQAASNAASAHIPSIYRFNADGTADTTFLGTGFNAGRYDGVSSGDHVAVRMLPDGRIQAAGRSTANANGGRNGFGFKRYLAGGTQQVSARREHDLFTGNRGAAAFYPDGRTLWAHVCVVGGAYQYVLARADSNGTADPTFSGGPTGIATTAAVPPRILLLADGRFLLAGTTGTPSSSRLSVFRFHADGGIDSTFGTNGAVHASFTPNNDECHDAAVYPDGRILLAGHARVGFGQPALVRLLPDGTPDSTLSDDGMQVVNLNGNAGTHYFRRVLILPDQRILAAGYDFASNGGDFFLVRFAADQASAVDLPERSHAPLLSAPFPNPSRAAATLTLELERPQDARVDVIDAAGRLVVTLHRGPLAAGRHAVRWDGRDAQGWVAPAGVYFARLATAGGVETRRMVRVR